MKIIEVEDQERRRGSKPPLHQLGGLQEHLSSPSKTLVADAFLAKKKP